MGKPETSLTFYGGVSEIGGNKILVEDKKTRVFFDFGQSFSFGERYFTGWLCPRVLNGLGDFFEFDMLPRLRGLYSEQQLRFTHIPYVKPRFDAVFLSHAHFDHVAHIQFLDEDIPLFLGVGTKLFLESMEETSGFCDYGKHKFEMFRTGDKIKVNDIIIEPIHVDHSIPAAYGFIIHTSSGTIVYTGDLRMHGARKDLTDDFVREAKDCKPEVLICEGTRMADRETRKNYSELQVERLGEELVASTDKIVFVTHYSRDMDRFRSFYTVAKNNGRKIVVSPKTAHLLSKLVSDKRLHLPDPLKDEDILVYYKRKKSGKFDERDYYAWEREFMDKMVTHEFVHRNQSKLLMDLDFYQFAELVDIRPDPGSHFVHSMSEPFSEEDIKDEVMHNWLSHFKMQFHQLHASGHLGKEQLASLVKSIEPDKVFPVHTENPRMFRNISRNAHTVQYGKTYVV